MEGAVTRLTVYPIKSCAPVQLSSMAFDRYGPAWDRRYMVVDPKGRFMTARTFPRLLRVQPALTPEGVWVGAPGMPDLFLPSRIPENAQAYPVTVWRDALVAPEVGASSSAWFSRYLETECRLVLQTTRNSGESIQIGSLGSMPFPLRMAFPYCWSIVALWMI